MQLETNLPLTLPVQPIKEFKVTLQSNPEDLHKLTGQNPMPSWIIGEKIAEAIKKGLTQIQIDVHGTFLQYHV